MEQELTAWLLIIIIGVINFTLRFVPIALIAHFELPNWLKHALVYVPPAVLTAIIAPALFFPGGAPTIAFDPPRLLAATFAALVAWKTRSALWTVILGDGHVVGIAGSSEIANELAIDNLATLPKDRERC